MTLTGSFCFGYKKAPDVFGALTLLTQRRLGLLPLEPAIHFRKYFRKKVIYDMNG